MIVLPRFFTCRRGIFKCSFQPPCYLPRPEPEGDDIPVIGSGGDAAGGSRPLRSACFVDGPSVEPGKNRGSGDGTPIPIIRMPNQLLLGTAKYGVEV